MKKSMKSNHIKTIDELRNMWLNCIVNWKTCFSFNEYCLQWKRCGGQIKKQIEIKKYKSDLGIRLIDI